MACPACDFKIWLRHIQSVAKVFVQVQALWGQFLPK